LHHQLRDHPRAERGPAGSDPLDHAGELGSVRDRVFQQITDAPGVPGEQGVA
jgi:hypothetical protein